ncbi:unnamed protein product [Gadus morhua 'NCC']
MIQDTWDRSLGHLGAPPPSPGRSLGHLGAGREEAAQPRPHSCSLTAAPGPGPRGRREGGGTHLRPSGRLQEVPSTETPPLFWRRYAESWENMM